MFTAQGEIRRVLLLLLLVSVLLGTSVLDEMVFVTGSACACTHHLQVTLFGDVYTAMGWISIQDKKLCETPPTARC